MNSGSRNTNSPDIIFLMHFAIFVWTAIHPGSVFANRQPGLFIPGEVMVRFRQDTEPDRLLSKALHSKRQNPEILKPAADLLSSNIEMPLIIKQLLSGRWVLLRIDSKRLLNDSLTRLRNKNPAAEILLKIRDDKSLYRITDQEFDIAFKPGSQEYEVVSTYRMDGDKQKFTALVAGLTKTLGYPVQGRVDRRKHLILSLDQREITLLLEKRLRQLTSIIEAVQLNYIATLMQ